MEIILSILKIILAIFVLGILVFVHELGHFLMARLGGIAVDEFSIGFGKELFGFEHKGTRYKISMIPFGGYCKMRGEESNDRENIKKKEAAKKDVGLTVGATATVEATPKEDATSDATAKVETSETPVTKDEKKDKETRVKDPHAMYNRPAWARVIAILGGPVFNFIFAIILLSIMYMAGFQKPDFSSTVWIPSEYAAGQPSPAYVAGMRSGDTIIKIGDEEVNVFSDIAKKIAYNDKKELSIVYTRGNITNTAKVKPVMHIVRKMPTIGIETVFKPIVGGVISNTPAMKAELQPGDKIVSIDGIKIEFYHEFQEYLTNKANAEVALVIERKQKPVKGQKATNLESVLIEKKVVLTTNSEMITNGEVITAAYPDKGFLGISLSGMARVSKNEIIKSRGFFGGIAAGFVQSGVKLKEIFDGLKQMVTGRIGFRENVSGPIQIVKITSDVIGLQNFAVMVNFIVIISLALGFFNLLPLPGLDGGHFLINTFEMITRIRPPEKFISIVEMVGFVFIVALSAFVLFNDVFKLVGDFIKGLK